MARMQWTPAFDGTTGRSEHGGRRTHVIQLLRDSREPLSVADVAEKVGIHINTARFHLESLVDAGLADRAAQLRTTPGRPKVLYVGTLPNQTHERAQAYRLLADALTTAVAHNLPNATQMMYELGVTWGKFLTDPPVDGVELSEDQIMTQLMAKLDALWFAPELAPIQTATDPQLPIVAISSQGKIEAGNLPAPHPGVLSTREVMIMHNCPFQTAANRSPEVVCALHAGLINGTLSELGSNRRTLQVTPMVGDHHCAAPISEVDVERWEETTAALDMDWMEQKS
ncbi:helix-turn-helix domain-containing protein [Jonesiaceae bacterium BS-20]|uniref:Helix-turn-helix domain-containing protein n=1 Tax=Jonesiaceae bacterium BS-20 TaxID=3120821 RepID=A0AAU7DZT1_9MICO